LEVLRLPDHPIPETHEDLLEKKGFAHMATLGPDGAPHNSPVWYDWDGSHVLVSHTKERQKFRNVKKDGRVSLSILDPDDPYRYLEIRGVVDEIVDDPEKTLIHRLAKKYRNRDRYTHDGPGDNRVIFKIKPLKTTSRKARR
jgi:PPOX class probable F420-dependent enzyme